MDPNKIKLMLNSRGGISPSIITDGIVHGLDRHVPINVFIEAYMDERETSNGGQGYWKVWVNDQIMVDRIMPTLSASGTTPAIMSIGTYMTRDSDCNNKYRVTYWDRLRMLEDNKITHVDLVNTSSDIRMYGDDVFRYTTTPFATGVLANFGITTPVPDATKSIDVTITKWNLA